MIQTKKFIAGIVTLAVAAVVAVFILLAQTQVANGGSFPGTSGTLKVATTTAVGPQAVPARTVFAINGTCKARVISTQASAIMISFGEPNTLGNISSSTLSGTVGHLQGASTTVAYDAETYGCGRLTVWSYASSTLTVSEF